MDQGDMDSIYEMEYENTMPAATTSNNNDEILITRKIPLEIALMIRVRHVDRCIRIIDYLEQKHCFIIVMERLEQSKDLFDYITDLALAAAADSHHQHHQTTTTTTSNHHHHQSTSGPTAVGLNEHVARDFFRLD